MSDPGNQIKLSAGRDTSTGDVVGGDKVSGAQPSKDSGGVWGAVTTLFAALKKLFS